MTHPLAGRDKPYPRCYSVHVTSVLAAVRTPEMPNEP